ncbi:uncharacterized protein [Heterodontus francisci]|uniref:uncharacterized protein n=1 Tax=Heterodontus francisci TaxID=7792 RepID=UPI00355B2E83
MEQLIGLATERSFLLTLSHLFHCFIVDESTVTGLHCEMKCTCVDENMVAHCHSERQEWKDDGVLFDSINKNGLDNSDNQEAQSSFDVVRDKTSPLTEYMWETLNSSNLPRSCCLNIRDDHMAYLLGDQGWELNIYGHSIFRKDRQKGKLVKENINETVRKDIGSENHDVESEDTTNLPEMLANQGSNEREELKEISTRKKIVLGKLMGLKADKSPGSDDPHPRLLTEVTLEVMNALVVIFPNALDSGAVTTNWSLETEFAAHDGVSCTFGEGSDRENVLSVIPNLFSHLSLPVNLLAIVILSRGKCGLSSCTTRYLVAMATADLLVIVTEVILRWISYYYFPGSFLNITPVCSVVIVLLHAATDCSVWFTVTFSFDRFVAICCQKLKTEYCTEKTATVVQATTWILLCLKNIPFYFTYEPREIINNVPWFCFIKPIYFTDPGWMGFDWLDTVLTPLLPFSLILLLNALTVRHILLASRVRKGLRGQSKGENRIDPEMESRRKSVILLFTISGSFILLWLMNVINFLYYSITGTDPRNYNDSEEIFEEVADMLQILSCCTNTFIYGVTQSKFREQLKSAGKYPVTSIIQLINKQNN